MMIKKSLADYTEVEFSELVTAILTDEGSVRNQLARLIYFNRLVMHPAGSDLLFSTQEGADCSVKAVIQAIKMYHSANGLPVFKT